MELEEALQLFLKYPNIKSVKFHCADEWLHEIEFYPPVSATQPIVQGVSMLGTNEIPPDDVMMFASTPTFDELIDKAKGAT